MHSTITPAECGMRFSGSRRQIEYAGDLATRAIRHIWQQGFHGTSESFLADVRSLPQDATWWIDNKEAPHAAAMKVLGIEYATPAGSDY